MDSNVGRGPDALYMLNQGIELFIIIRMKNLFDKVVSHLDLPSPPVFCVDNCGEAGVRVTIKLHVSNLPTASGERYWQYVVEGEPMSSHSAAECSAIKKAFQLLEKNHLIRILDFSSKISSTAISKKTDELLSQANVALESVLLQWHRCVKKCKKAIEQLDQHASTGFIFGHRTPTGMVYGVLSDYLSDMLKKLYGRANEAKNGLIQSQAHHALHNSTLDQRSISPTSNVHFHDVHVSSKFILQYVMDFFGLEPPYYICHADANGIVKSTVTINFPYLDKINIGGSIELEGQSCNYAEAQEEAAFSALVFIEQNLRTKVIDYNYSKRKKVIQEESTLSRNLVNILGLGDSVKMLFGELINSIEVQRLQYSFDPSLIFTGPMSQDQIDSFHFCNTILHDVDQFSVSCYAACDPHFEVLKKITWNHLVQKTNAHIQ